MSKFQLSVLAVLMAALGMTCSRSSGEGGEPKPASPVAPADASSPKNAVQLLQDYARLVSPENIDQVFDLFSEDALLEFPFFKSIGIPARLAGREAIRKQIAPFVKNETENFRFHDIKIWASAEPDRAFGEYSVTAKIKSTGRVYNQTYVARCETKNGRIVHLIEYANPINGAIAIFPGGLRDLTTKK
jgi:ketosteroid isomerase-like protein